MPLTTLKAIKNQPIRMTVLNSIQWFTLWFSLENLSALKQLELGLAVLVVAWEKPSTK